jgi:GNAT superfamily N-acetyltransferase
MMTQHRASREADMGPLQVQATATPPPTDQLRSEETELAAVRWQEPEARNCAVCRPHIMPLGPRHQADFQDLLLDLDKKARFSRFAGTVSDTWLVRYPHHAISTAAWIAGAFVDDRLRGVVEVYESDRSEPAEAAFVVAEGWRGRGLGSALLRAAMQWPHQPDRTTLRMIFSRSNWPMRKFASKAQARFDLVLDEIVADIAIGPAQVGPVHQIEA